MKDLLEPKHHAWKQINVRAIPKKITFSQDGFSGKVTSKKMVLLSCLRLDIGCKCSNESRCFFGNNETLAAHCRERNTRISFVRKIKSEKMVLKLRNQQTLKEQRWATSKV